MVKFSLPLRIHCWGGFGSQLFALALAIDINTQNPNKKICMVFHSAGVTSRSLELTNLPNFIEVKVVDDFKQITELTSVYRNSRAVIFRLVKLFMRFTYLSLELENNWQLKHIKPWTRAVRGHYSGRAISNSSIERIMEIFIGRDAIRDLGSSQSNSAGLHYRLGDLLNLNSKTHIAPNRLHDVVLKLESEQGVYQLDVYSDSGDKAFDFLNSLQNVIDLKVITLEVNEAIKRLVQYDYFIGTNSKITIWAVLFRINQSSKLINFVPTEIKSYLELNIAHSKYSSQITYY